MEPHQIEISLQLGRVRYLPGTWDKRFGRKLCEYAQTNHAKTLTTNENEWMFRLLYKYRKQLPVTYQRYKDHPYCTKKS